MRFENRHWLFDGKQFLQTAAAHVRQRKRLANTGIEQLVTFVVGIRILDKFASVLSKQGDDFLSDWLLRPLQPIVAMHDVIRAQPADVLGIAQRILRNDFTDSLQIFNNRLAFLVRQQRITAITGNRRVGKHAGGHAPQLGRSF